MSSQQQMIRAASIGAYFALSFGVLYWFAGGSCATKHLPGMLTLTLASTVWDLLACVISGSLAHRVMNLRLAAPLLAGAITGVGLASVPFWIYRGYGHFLFEGTWADTSCLFTEGAMIAFLFVVAPALGLLSVIHGILWLRTRDISADVVE